MRLELYRRRLFQELACVDDESLLPVLGKVTLIAGDQKVCAGRVSTLQNTIIVFVVPPRSQFSFWVYGVGDAPYAA